MNQDIIADLELFNEKASVLINSSFADAALRTQSGFMFSHKSGGNPESILVGPEGESVDALLLTLRMFMQNNDRISIQNISKIYKNTQELGSFRQEFDLIKTKINMFLEAGTGVKFSGQNFSNKEVIELLLYGSRGHSNKDKEAKLKEIQRNKHVSNLFLNIVNSAIADFITGIFAISEVNRRALQEIMK